MGSERKKSWLLKDPDFVPKNKLIRIIIFILFNSILVSLLPILVLFINYPYGYLCWIPVFCFLLLFNLKAFYIHVERYPLNDYLEYKFVVGKDILNFESNEHFIEIINNDKIFIVKLKEKKLIFDLRGCLFPLLVVKAYLGRQFIMSYINKYKLVSDTMAKNVVISKLYKEYFNIRIDYIKGDKTTSSYLVKDGKTKMNFIMKAINGHGYVFCYVTYHGGGKYFVKVSEQDFIETKNKYLHYERN